MQKFLTPSQRSRILADMKPLHVMLIEWRDMLKLTDSDAARRCGISAQLWAQLVSGETSDPRTSTMLKVAEGTGMPMERLAKAARMQQSPDPAVQGAALAHAS